MAGSTLAAVVESVLDALVQRGFLPASKHPLASAALVGAVKPTGVDGKQHGSRSRIRRASSKGADSQHDSSGEFFRMLEPDKGEEALDLLLAHVAFVDAPVMAFVRLAVPIDAGEWLACSSLHTSLDAGAWLRSSDLTLLILRSPARTGVLGSWEMPPRRLAAYFLVLQPAHSQSPTISTLAHLVSPMAFHPLHPPCVRFTQVWKGTLLSVTFSFYSAPRPMPPPPPRWHTPSPG